MINAPYYFSTYLRIATAALLFLLIGFKVTLVAIAITTDVKKEIFAVAEDDDNEKAKNNFEKEKEFINLNSNYLSQPTTISSIIHYTAYNINYYSFYYNQITIPPPDLNLQSYA